MKIAILTKKHIENNPVRTDILTALDCDGNFDLQICKNSSEIAPDCDKILIFGGDGTVLEAVTVASNLKIPLLGINLGNLGFLAELEPTVSPKAVIEALQIDNFSNRMTINTQIGDKMFCSLNDVVIKSNSTRPIHLDLSIDGNYVDSYHSDGLIVSTPTGSTAYSLSAGGPVLAPQVDAIVIIPVCPHSLHSRPLVISANSKISVEVVSTGSTIVVIDGNKVVDCTGKQKFCIEKSDKSVKFVDLGNTDFFNKLLLKMNSWGTTKK